MLFKRPALSGPLHVVWHIILVLLGWSIFGGLWWIVLQQTSNSLSSIIWLFSGALILLPVITLLWVLHNREIYAHKGPRRHVQVVEARYEQDWMGRAIQANFDQLKQAGSITILSNSEEKFFHAQHESSPRLQHFAS